jgi:glycosyltransferase involved in cell wall biosynthesis
MKQAPLVSVICLCYNHARFVEEAIQSVLAQTYTNIQVIVVDDASSDNSVAVIRDVIYRSGRTDIQFLPLSENIGNCRAFNQGLALAKGEYIIDLATDDYIVPERIERQVKFFSSLDESYGVIFSDAIYVNEDGKFLYHHFEELQRKRLVYTIPRGDVFKDLLTTYFISSPAMMTRKKVFDTLNGYDEELAYEDFDFWVRSSRLYKYNYTDEKLTVVRKSARSMSTGWYKIGDRQLHSTYLVCRKAQKLIRTLEERNALISRVRYELRQSILSENFSEGDLFLALLKELAPLSLSDRFLSSMLKFKLPLTSFRNLYHRIRFR